LNRKIPLINILLFFLTVMTTFWAGFLYEATSPPTSIYDILKIGWRFALPLLGILLAHEMGHYIAARIHKVKATLPYFIPFPFFFGTLGAIIRIKERIRSRKALLDIGVAGPLAGLLVTIPVLIIGISTSEIRPLKPDSIYLMEGHCLLYSFLIYIIHGKIPEGYDIFINSTAFAGWAGLFITMLNLLPIGQLDGGHIAYALLGERQNKISGFFHLSLIFLGIGIGAYYGILAYLRGANTEVLLHESLTGFNWIVWATVLKLLEKLGTKKHPPVDDMEIDRIRLYIGIFTMILFLFLFMPVPLKQEGL